MLANDKLIFFIQIPNIITYEHQIMLINSTTNIKRIKRIHRNEHDKINSGVIW